MILKRTLVIAALLLPLAAASAGAQQDYDRPPAGFGDQGRDGDAPPYRGTLDADPGAVSVRVGKLEGRIRDMTGQIEELQNANRKLTDQMQKFQADIEFRLQDKGGVRPAKHSEVTAPSGLAGPAMDAEALPPKAVAARPARGDAFDPAAAPSAPGAPKPLGSVASSTPDDAPMDLTAGSLRPSTGSSGALAPTLQLPSSQSPSGVTPKTTAGTVTPNGTIIASLGSNAAKEEFDVALGYYKDKQYESAEKGFTAFIEKNPKSRLIADATYYIGESFAQRGRQREAAEQYLKISTDFANSARAPEAMLRLGVSLKALGAKEQACATFTEVTRKYPNAPSYVKTGADREAKRAQC